MQMISYLLGNHSISLINNEPSLAMPSNECHQTSHFYPQECLKNLLIKLKPKPGEKKPRTDWRVKPPTINRELACLKHMFSLAQKWKIIDGNPVKDVQLFQERQMDMRILTREEIGRLLEAASSHLKPIITIALNTGMRRNEILCLRWNDIDFE